MAEYEYKDYVQTFQGGKWELDANHSILDAKLYFWQQVQQGVREDIEKYKDEGWEIIGEVGSASIQLREWREFHVPAISVILAIMTLGLFTLLELVTGQFWESYCTATECRIKMRRRTK